MLSFKSVEAVAFSKIDDLCGRRSELHTSQIVVKFFNRLTPREQLVVLSPEFPGILVEDGKSGSWIPRLSRRTLESWHDVSDD